MSCWVIIPTYYDPRVACCRVTCGTILWRNPLLARGHRASQPLWHSHACARSDLLCTYNGRSRMILDEWGTCPNTELCTRGAASTAHTPTPQRKSVLRPCELHDVRCLGACCFQITKIPGAWVLVTAGATSTRFLTQNANVTHMFRSHLCSGAWVLASFLIKEN